MPPSRVDANQQPIVDGLRALGYSVDIQSRFRGHRWDLTVFHPSWPRWEVRLLEVKAPGGKWTPGELEFGAEFPVTVVHSLEECLEALQ